MLSLAEETVDALFSFDACGVFEFVEDADQVAVSDWMKGVDLVDFFK